MININAYGGNWLHILLKMTLQHSGSFGCVVTSKQWIGYIFVAFSGKLNFTEMLL